MTASKIPAPPFNRPMLDGTAVSAAWQFWFSAVYQALYGEGFDKTDAAYQAAMAAAPASAEIAAVGGLHQIGSTIGGNIGVALYKAMTPVAGLPSSGNAEGDWAYAFNGRKIGEAAGAGSGVPAWWSNGGWYAVDSGALVAA